MKVFKENFAQFSDQMQAQSMELRKTISERDAYRKNTAEMLEQNVKIKMEKEIMMTTFKKRVSELEEKARTKTEEFEAAEEQRLVLEKERKTFLVEREKMKERIKKLKKRGGKFDILQKICKMCGKDYNEKENLNWSCRTHRSEYSGEIWWCCGKSSKDAIGCLVQKHMSKDEEDEDEDDKAQYQSKMKLRCLCCKEIGHLIDRCPRDPNIRTKAEINSDYVRIQKIKDNRKLNADTVVLTTHLLKKCVQVPVFHATEQEETAYQGHPFKRGAMKFDDYNYHIYNPYILVENNTKNLQEHNRQKKMKNSKGIALDGGEQSIKLEEEVLAKSNLDNYEFDSINTGDKEKEHKTPTKQLKSQESNEDQPAEIAPEDAEAKPVGEGDDGS